LAEANAKAALLAVTLHARNGAAGGGRHLRPRAVPHRLVGGLHRFVGIGFSTGGDNWSLGIGYQFEGFGSVGDAANDNNIVSARLTYGPSISKNTVLHLGASFFRRSQHEGSYQQTIEENPINHQVAELVAAAPLSVGSETFYGLEFAMISGPFSAQAEWANLKGNIAPDDPFTFRDPRYDGGYIEVSYFLTGEHRNYEADAGEFGRTKVRRPVFDGGMGAFQLAARYDWLDLTHENLGEKQDAYVLGLSWLLSNYSRMMANYSHATVKTAAGVTNNSADAFALRFQVDW